MEYSTCNDKKWQSGEHHDVGSSDKSSLSTYSVRYLVRMRKREREQRKHPHYYSPVRLQPLKFTMHRVARR